ncbi:hypothetical protein FPOA_13351 [Fusarium poae]|uniref:HNH nuclease domain-containing protein n=1 Tax=Fusarium poae TaxID=36050 RepID=A0A1B8A640_FUSPO|nr:hypothetical protein FPOA_13351 [Fusarium poae]
MPPAEALHRHQSSLEGILDFSAQPPLTPAQRLSAGRRFDQLVNHFDAPDDSCKDYDRVKLVRLTYEYARSEESKGYFLRAFFESAGIPIDADQEDIDLTDADKQAKLRDSFVNFAEYLFENFFLPLKSSTKKTPQPSPASHSAVQRAQGGEGQNFLERQNVSQCKQATGLFQGSGMAILNMFDNGAAFLVEGTEIDRPRNALTLTHRLHGFFGDFQIYFEPVDQELHTYRINTFIQDIMEYEFPSLERSTSPNHEPLIPFAPAALDS